MNRQSALARSYARLTVAEFLSDDEMSQYDTEGIVTDLVERGIDFRDLSGTERFAIMEPHEYTDEDGMTDAKMAAAIARSRTGWNVFIKRGRSEVQMISVRNPKLTTEDMVRGHVQALFGDDVEASIFPLVG